jgi:hypothetical protein
VDAVPVGFRVAVIPVELDLELELSVAHDGPAHRASAARARPAPYAIRTTIRQLDGVGHLTSFPEWDVG